MFSVRICQNPQFVKIDFSGHHTENAAILATKLTKMGMILIEAYRIS